MNRRVLMSSLFAASFVAVLSVVALTQEEIRPVRRITVPALVSAVAFSPDGKTLIAWDPAGYAAWDIETGRSRGREPVLGKACQRVTTLPRSQDGVTIGVHCRDRLYMFDVASTAPLGEWPLGEKRTPAAFTAARDGSVAAVVIAGQLGWVDILARGESTAKSRVQVEQEVETLSIAANGSRLASGTFAGVRTWDLPGGTPRTTTEGTAAHALSPNGQLVAVDRSGGPALVDAATGQVRHVLKGPSGQLRFSADGTRVIGWTNQQLAVWDVESGSLRLQLKAESFVTAAASPDGSHVATVSLDLRGRGATTTLAVWRP